MSSLHSVPPRRVQNAVVIDSRKGRFYGTCTAICGARLTLLTHGRLAAGEQVDLRMELAEEGRAVSGPLRVEQVEHPERGGPAVVHGVLEQAPGVPQWGGTRWEPESDEQPTQHGLEAQPLAVQGEGPTELRAPPARRPSVVRAMRAAVGGVRVQTRRVLGPRARVRLSPDASAVLVRWRAWPDAPADWERQLSSGRLTMHVPRAPLRDATLVVHLVLPDGRSLRCPGRVLARVQDSFSVALEWSPDQRARLAAALG
jgi:hypothetical protein